MKWKDICSNPEKFKEMAVRAVVKVGVRQASRIFGLSPKTVRKKEIFKKMKSVMIILLLN
jgi:transposase-like protein